MGFIRDLPDGEDQSMEKFSMHASQVNKLSDERLIQLWYDLDRFMSTETLTLIYSEMCLRNIPRVIEGPGLQAILRRIALIYDCKGVDASDLLPKERVCKHCKANYTGTAYGLCSGCGRFQ